MDQEKKKKLLYSLIKMLRKLLNVKTPAVGEEVPDHRSPGHRGGLLGQCHGCLFELTACVRVCLFSALGGRMLI